jgi:hypothetical protein
MGNHDSLPDRFAAPARTRAPRCPAWPFVDHKGLVAQSDRDLDQGPFRIADFHRPRRLGLGRSCQPPGGNPPGARRQRAELRQLCS